MPIAIDYHFLGQLEKECALNGYVPLPEKEKSGVTISTGFDLGARNQNDLRVLGIRGDLLNRLLPYLGLKGTKALAHLKKQPLKISLAECNQIDGALHSHFVENLSRRFNKTTGSKRPQFDALPPSAQTVIMSVAYQYGLELNSATPQFWAAVTEQDYWGKTIEILENFGDSHPTRRKKEAAYLKKGLN